jgi:hypothetical protein
MNNLDKLLKKATGRPWDTTHADDAEAGRFITGGEAVLVADAYPDSAQDLGLPEDAEWRANARLIVLAVNKLEACVETLRDLVAALSDSGLGTMPGDTMTDTRRAYEDARALLASIEEEAS